MRAAGYRSNTMQQNSLSLDVKEKEVVVSLTDWSVGIY